jgi:hypothetical protein
MLMKRVNFGYGLALITTSVGPDFVNEKEISGYGL